MYKIIFSKRNLWEKLKINKVLIKTKQQNIFCFCCHKNMFRPLLSLFVPFVMTFNSPVGNSLSNNCTTIQKSTTWLGFRLESILTYDQAASKNKSPFYFFQSQVWCPWYALGPVGPRGNKPCNNQCSQAVLHIACLHLEQEGNTA